MFGRFVGRIMSIIGGNDLNPEFLGYLQGKFIYLYLLGYIVWHDLQENSIFADGLNIIKDHPIFNIKEQIRHGAGRKDYQAINMIQEGFMVDPGTVIESFNIGNGQELQKIPPTGLILDKKSDMVASFPLLFDSHIRNKIHLRSDNRFYAGFKALLLVFNCAVDIAVIAEGQMSLLKFFSQGGVLFGSPDPIKDGVFIVEM